jgi:hypothetical protein
MEEPLLFVVDAAFQISNRGCVLVPGLSAEPGGPTVRVGSPIRLLLPEGKVINTAIRGIEMLNYGSRRPEKITLPILLPPDISKEQVPVGTKVLLCHAATAGADGA